MKTFTKRPPLLRDSFIATLLFAAALIYCALIWMTKENLLLPNIFQSRDIRRALDLYQNRHWIWFGPELTGGGQLPGPFYYYLIGLPMILTNSVFSIYLLEYVLFSLTAALVWYFLKRKFSIASAFIFYFMFLTSPFIQFNLTSFMNPSFQFIFLSIAICSLYFHKNNKALILGGLALGLTLQIHFAASLVLLGFLVFLLNQSDLPLSGRLKKVGVILASVLIPLLPYVLFRLTSDSDSYYDITSSYLRIIYYLKNIYKYLNLQTSTSFAIVFLKEFYVIPALLLCSLKRKDLHAKFGHLPTLIWFSSLALPSVFASLFVLRYAIPFFFLNILLIAICVPALSGKLRNLFYSMILLGIVFNVLFPLYPSEPDEEQISSRTSLESGQRIIQSIAATTNWDYSYFRAHTFALGLNYLDDFSAIYPAVSKQITSTYDGLIMIKRNNFNFTIPKNIAEAMKSSRIECLKREVIENYDLCYYNFAKTESPHQWNNIGNVYDTLPGLPQTPTNFSGAIKLGPNEARLYYNACEYIDPDCFVYFNLKILPDSLLNLEILGRPLANTDTGAAPRWTWYLQNPVLNIQCGSGSFTLPIADKIGFDHSRNTLHTPFDDNFKLPCSRPDSIVIESKTVSFFVIGSGKNNRGTMKSAFSQKWDPVR